MATQPVVIKSLINFMSCMKPDIAYAVSKMSCMKLDIAYAVSKLSKCVNIPVAKRLK